MCLNQDPQVKIPAFKRAAFRDPSGSIVTRPRTRAHFTALASFFRIGACGGWPPAGTCFTLGPVSGALAAPCAAGEGPG